MHFKLLSIIALAFAIAIAGCDEPKQKNTQLEKVIERTVKIKTPRDGLYKSYYDEAETKLMSEIEYTGGYRDGKAIDYYKNGQIRLKGEHMMGKNHGSFVYYHEDGRVYRKMQYDYGKLHGWDSVFYNSGRLKHAVPYREGEVVPGTIEIDAQLKQVAKPKIKIREVNRIEISGEYYLFASLTEHIKGVRFEIGLVGNGTAENPQTGFDQMAFLDKLEKEALFILPMERGYEFTGKIVIKATGKTKRGNPFQVLQVFPVVFR
jgi:antitoxin component YwqK of YwqJK toxin-antitoxin module